MKIYVVQHGAYSDTHVVCVTDDVDKSAALAALDCNGLTLEFELNVLGDRLLQGYRQYDVSFTPEVSRVEEQGYDLYESDEPMTVYGGEEPYIKGEAWSVVARSEDEAIKIASEKHQRWRINNANSR